MNAKTNTFLAFVKETYNEKIYKTTRATFNASGKDAAIDYLLTFVREDKQAEVKACLLAQ